MDHAFLLFGTDEPPAAAVALTAGGLKVTLQAGSLRHLTVGGHEIIRGIACVVRDAEWGTCATDITDLAIRSESERFLVTYRGECRSGEQVYRYQARIEASPRRLFFGIRGEAVTDFSTARLGFVVLHPQSVRGRPVEVLHADGRLERARFPDLVSPYQPFMDIRAITHEPAPGLSVTCRMEGDTFEMEDQRNWTDASFKTYVRPIGLPWPYWLRQGETNEQSVELTLTGEAPAAAATGPVRIAAAGTAGALPRLGLLLDPEVTLSQEEIALVRALGPAHLRLRFDARRHDAAMLRRHARTAAAVGAKLMLEAVLPGQAVEPEAEAIARAAREATVEPAAVFVVPEPDMKATLPGSTWPDCPPLEDVYRAMRKAFPATPLGGGSYCFFAEFNRKRPPAALLDTLTFCTSAIVHAADDITVMENLATLPAIFASAQQIAEGKPLHVGPSQIGFRENPYGTAPAANPHGIRTPMTDRDPRQRGLFTAAWATGYLACCAEAGINTVTLAAPVGGAGVMRRDEAGAGAEGALYPIYHVLRLFAGAGKARAVAVRSSDPGRVIATAWREEGHATLLVANLTASTQAIVVEGFDGLRSAGELDVTSCQTAARDPAFFDHMSRRAAGAVLDLGPYAVRRFVAASH